MTPKYRGFKAITAIPDDNGNVQKWSSSGIKRRVTEKAIEIIELPVGTWTEDYKTFLEAEVAKWCTQSCGLTLHRQTSASPPVCYRSRRDRRHGRRHASSHDRTKTLRMTNVHLFCADSIVTKFEDTATIIRAHGKIRLETYHKRKAFQEKELEALLIRLERRFVLEVIEGKIVLRKADLEAQLVREFPDLNGLDYLIQMPISSLTSEKRDALVADVVKAEELEVLVNTTAVGMWMRELDELRTELLKDAV
jgi:DNA topoisomerase-2